MYRLETTITRRSKLWRFRAEQYPGGDWGWHFGEIDPDGFYVAGGAQSRVFTFDSRDDCIKDMCDYIERRLSEES